MDNKLTFERNTNNIVKKCHQIMFRMFRLRYFGVSSKTLHMFYLLTYVCLLAGIDQGTPPFSVRGHLLHFSPGVSHLHRFFFRVSLPGVSWPTSSSLPWGVSCDGLTGDGVWWFPECMSYLPPFSLLYFIFYG